MQNLLHVDDEESVEQFPNLLHDNNKDKRR